MINVQDSVVMNFSLRYITAFLKATPLSPVVRARSKLGYCCRDGQNIEMWIVVMRMVAWAGKFHQVYRLAHRLRTLLVLVML